MNAIWQKFKWALTHLSWVLAAIIVAIDPKHIDNLVEKHPSWAGLIMAVWAMLMAWANKTKASEGSSVYPPGTPQSPVHSQPSSQKPYTKGLS